MSQVSETIDLEDEARIEIEERGWGSPINYVPRLLMGALDDLRTIAQSVSYLPELAQTLGSIQGRVETLDDEVRRMRAAVESMRGDVTEMKDSVRPLEATLEDLERSIHPLRRATGRLGRRSAPPPEDIQNL